MSAVEIAALVVAWVVVSLPALQAMPDFLPDESHTMLEFMFIGLVVTVFAPVLGLVGWWRILRGARRKP